MSFFPGPFGGQSPSGASSVQQQDVATRQAAIQRLAMQSFQQSCLFKTVLAGAGGFVIGGMMGAFISGMRYDAPGAFALPGAVPGGATPEAFNKLKWYRQLWEGVRDMGQSGLRTGRSFGKIGAIFSLTECVIESYRGKSDFVNPVLGGCVTGAILSASNGPLAMCGGCAGFAAFSAAIEVYLHRETLPED